MKLKKENLREEIAKNLLVNSGKKIQEAESHEIFQALAKTIVELVSANWYKTTEKYHNNRQLHYLSSEFLMGRALGNNLINLGLTDDVKEIFQELKIDYNFIEEAEEDYGTGNGGLGRLAACFLDSLATLDLPGTGYSIRYKNGIFNQKIIDGFQVEQPETWLKYGDPWSVRKISDEVQVDFKDFSVRAIPFDTPVIGYDTKNINTLRLWESAPIEDMNYEAFNNQDYTKALWNANRAEDISRILYPNDSTEDGKKLRLRQQYFFVSATLQDVIRKFKKIHGKDFSKFSELNVIQLNDTHPTIAIPELTRILVDNEGLAWDEAWKIVVKTFAYTNHTILSEALEKWWVGIYEDILPRIYEIIKKINTQQIIELEKKFGSNKENQNKINKMKIIQGDLIHMACLAIYGSSFINGVAALHTEILKTQELRDWYEMYPERFQNKTNGITQRRWLLLSNPELSALITKLIGDGWIKNLSKLKELERFVDNEKILDEFLEIKKLKKIQLSKYISEHQNIEINPDSIFDVQIKRLHEYKRQLLNIFDILDQYNQLKKNPDAEMIPVTYIFGSKAAPGYFRAKGIIKFINEVAKKINSDSDVKGKIKIVFVENYRVSLAHKLFPAADLSEQISTAGKEASGTGNMKFMLNGALTMGTLDGANVEIVEEAGTENNFIFGLRAEQVEQITNDGYNPEESYNKVEGLKKVVDSLVDGSFSDGGTGMFKEIFDSIMKGASWHEPDEYLVLKDFEDYRETRKKANETYKDKKVWAKKAWMNIANAGKFSSDRTIAEYAKDIWRIKEQKI
ncbi:MAG: glycogen/starch/alpha-glucan phosphorylase [Fusobacteriaceae bacterium]